jgi:preprotein translocase subunit SecD
MLRKQDATAMNTRLSIGSLATAFVLAVSASPACALSDDAHAVNQMRAANIANAKKLLDQEGGSRIVFKVDAAALREAVMTDLRDDVFKTLHDDRIPFSDLAVRDGNVEVRIGDPKNQQKLTSKLAQPTSSGPVTATDGGDGLMKLAPTDAGFAVRLQSLTMQSLEMMEQELRDNHIQAAVQPVGDDRIAVLLPGLTEPDRVAAIFNKRAKVAFRFVDSSMSPEEAQKGAPPTGSEVLLGFKDNKPYLVQKQVEIDGDDIIYAAPGFGTGTNDPIASFRFNAHGARRFAHLTADNVGRPFAIVINDRVFSAPVIREPITGGSGQISGNFTIQEANSVAMLLRSGALPGHLGVVDQEIVKPVAAKQ